jgi:hypothetical protein
MFITLTIDTSQKNKNKIKMHKNKFNAASGWRKKIHTKKRNLGQRFNAWKRSLKSHSYKLDGQIAMF